MKGQLTSKASRDEGLVLNNRNVLKTKEIFRRRLAKSFVRLQHCFRLFLFFCLSPPILGITSECLTFRRSRTIGVNIEYLIEAKPGEEFLAPIPAMNHVEMTVAEFLQAQRHAGHCAHECGIHHRAMRQINHKFAITAVQHLASELFQVPAVQETALSLHFHPYGWTIYPYLNR